MYLLVDCSGGRYPRHHTNPFSDEKCMGMKKKNDHSYQHQTCEFHNSALLKGKIFAGLISGRGWGIPLNHHVPHAVEGLPYKDNYSINISLI